MSIPAFDIAAVTRPLLVVAVFLRALFRVRGVADFLASIRRFRVTAIFFGPAVRFLTAADFLVADGIVRSSNSFPAHELWTL